MTTNELKSQIELKEIELKKLKKLKEELEQELEQEREKGTIFERAYGCFYRHINSDGRVVTFNDSGTENEIALYNAGNYCRDKETMEGRAKQETLSRLIWRWQKINDEPVDWGGYCITRDYEGNAYVTSISTPCIGVVIFSTREKAEECINKIVVPYIQELNRQEEKINETN